MSKDGVTINELSKMANVTVRTIRFYTDEGVLDEPAGRDRYARYTRKHYLQLCAAKQLKERFLPLRVIRDQIAALNEPELERLAGPVPHEFELRFSEAAMEHELAEHVYAAAEFRRQSVPRNQLRATNILSADAFLLSEEVAHRAEPVFFSESRDADTAADMMLRKQATATLGDIWHRIAISPTMELHVREDGMNELGEIKRILASLRRSK
jgi:DNA-binding transcriptional MerR regulator